MAVAIISVVVLSMVIMTIFNYVKSSRLIETEALGKATALSKEYAQSIHTDVEKAFIRARKMKDAFLNMKKRGLT
jgi:hypothetical protein